ncbi:hypothetical protein DFR52_101156 [Hoeflea marina]|uniref:DUF475 domain-containing protein n=1 Tax=Hoeflea marina TaxID=274592 RepID=A0A317PRV9_9HYPH|nr:hypothetical protein DFR52_101156 [Hoeflea marina]
MANCKYFTWAFLATILGLVLGTWLGWKATGTLAGAGQFLFICAVLAVLEISLSFDNAIVNAAKLKTMTPIWQHRFLTWGILIAVFGMRIVFPLAIVAVAAGIGPFAAIALAVEQPHEYARIMTESHVSIAAFGGTFLMMVGLGFFFNVEKDVHWIHWIETHLARIAGIKGVEVFLVLVTMVAFSRLLDAETARTFLHSAIYGLITFLAVEILGSVLDASQQAIEGVAKGGLGAFLYLEVLDASFSFDGVIGAFALSQNLFVIAIGLGIGAMYVRSMTIMLVEKGTLSHYRYLEHGAFWAILALAVIMYAQTMVHIPEVITGLFGAGLIGVALWSSIRWKKANPEEDPALPAAAD